MHIVHTLHTNLVHEVLEKLLDESRGTKICLNSIDGVKFSINRLLFAIAFPNINSLTTDVLINSEESLVCLPLKSEVLRNLLQLKLHGFINSADSTLTHSLVDALSILGEEITFNHLEMVKNFQHNKRSEENPSVDDKGNNETNVDVEVKYEAEYATNVNDTVDENVSIYPEISTDNVPDSNFDFYDEYSVLNESQDQGDGIDNNCLKEEVDESRSMKSTNRPKKCTVCEIKLRKNELPSHYKHYHPNLTLFSCQICEQEFEFKSILSKHLEWHRQKTPCSYCNRKVKGIEIHTEQVHPEHLQYSCLVCTYKAYTEKRLADHVRKHESKRGKCEKCNQSFRNIENHLKKHEVNKFECT